MIQRNDSTSGAPPDRCDFHDIFWFHVDLGDRIDLHGYGDQDDAQASAGTYLGVDKRGTWTTTSSGS